MGQAAAYGHWEIHPLQFVAQKLLLKEKAISAFGLE
jgi:hypothetical protein